MKEIIEILKNNNQTVATMESCTGGAVASAITNIEGASDVFKFGAVTYSNEYKIKMGVDPKIIEKYSVYSMETAMEMSKNMSIFTSSNYGIGITGKINKPDACNKQGNDSEIFISVYDKDNDTFFNFKMLADKEKNRLQNKELIISKLEIFLKDILKK